MKKIFLKSFLSVSFVFLGILPLKAKAEPQAGMIDEWYAHLTMDLMLGSKIQAAAIYNNRVPWLFYFYPNLKNLPRVPNTGLSSEEMIRMKPQYVILPIAQQAQEKFLKKADIPVSVMNFKNFAGLLDSVDQSAQLENTDFAFKQAKAYRNFVTELVGEEILKEEKTLKGKSVSLKKLFSLSAHKNANRPSVLHLSSLDPLMADGTETVIDEWIRLAGGRNALTISGNNRAMTWEQVFAANPDIIILGEGAGKWEKASIPKGAAFLPAIRAGHLYRNPTGIFLWDRYGVELPLQLLWAKAVIAGNSPNTAEMRQKMKDFYERFFDLHPSEEVLSHILKGEPPAE